MAQTGPKLGVLEEGENALLEDRSCWWSEPVAERLQISFCDNHRVNR